MGTGDTFAHDPANRAFLAADTVFRMAGWLRPASACTGDI
jgi:hypothetical protein